MPLYVRAGAVLPLGPVKQYVSEPINAPLTLRVYPGADGQFALYEDDGSSFAYEQGQCLRLVAEWTERGRQLKLALAAGTKMFGPAPREVAVELANGKGSQRIRFGGAWMVVRL